MTQGELTLTTATLEEWRLATRLNYGAWGKGVSLEDYIEREEFYLGKTQYATERRRGWSLKRNGDSVSSCESYERDIYYVLPSETTIRTAKCQSIGSVFTPPEYRGLGYASTMMVILRDQWFSGRRIDGPFLNLEGDLGIMPRSPVEQTLASNLYSDIGPKFYAKLGWKVHNSTDIEVPLSSQNCNVADKILQTALRLQTARFLKTETQVRQLEALDERILRQDLCRKASQHADKLVCALPLTFDCLEWFKERAFFYHVKLRGGSLENWSFSWGMASEDSLSYCFWAPDYKEDALVVLKFGRSEQFNWPLALSFAIESAKSLKLSKVVFWNREEALQSLLGSGMTAEVVAREESLSSLYFHTLVDPADILWLDNEKYAWV